MTAGKLVLEGGSHSLDRNVLDFVQRKKVEMDATLLAKQRKDDLDYLKSCHEADQVIARYSGVPVNKWRRKDEIVTYIKPVKRSGDAAMPSSRSEVEKRFNEWKDRSRRIVSHDEVVMNDFNLWLESKTSDEQSLSNIQG